MALANSCQAASLALLGLAPHAIAFVGARLISLVAISSDDLEAKDPCTIRSASTPSSVLLSKLERLSSSRFFARDVTGTTEEQKHMQSICLYMEQARKHNCYKPGLARSL